MKRTVAVLLSVVMMTFAFAGPASASGELGVSKNGTTWSNSLSNDLFDNSVRWVPGDTRTATFYVRNNSKDPGKLTIDLLGNHVGSLLDLGDVDITAKAGNGQWAVASDGAEHRLLTGTTVRSGAVVPVHVTVAFVFSSPNESQLLSTDLRFRVTLTQDGSGLKDETNGNGLPGTGAPDITWIVVLGSILLGTGIAVTTRRRNDPQGESHV